MRVNCAKFLQTIGDRGFKIQNFVDVVYGTPPKSEKETPAAIGAHVHVFAVNGFQLVEICSPKQEQGSVKLARPLAMRQLESQLKEEQTRVKQDLDPN